MWHTHIVPSGPEDTEGMEADEDVPCVLKSNYSFNLPRGADRTGQAQQTDITEKSEPVIFTGYVATPLS